MIKLEKQGFLVVPSIRDVKYLKKNNKKKKKKLKIYAGVRMQRGIVIECTYWKFKTTHRELS